MKDLSVVIGEPLYIEAQMDGFPSPEIKWFKDGTQIRPNENINFINLPNGIIGMAIENVRPEDAGIYTCTIANRLGEVTGTARVEVLPKDKKPEFIQELHDVVAVEGFPVKMEVKIDAHPAPKVTWNHDGEEIRPGGDHFKVIEQPDGVQCLIIDKVSPKDQGQYQVVATNEKGQTGSQGQLTVAPKMDESEPEAAPKFTGLLKNTSIDEGKEIFLSAPFTSNPLPEVIWSKDDEPLVPSERVMMTCDGKRVGLTILPAEVADAGVYSCLLANLSGEDVARSDVAVRKVYEKPIFQQKLSDYQQKPALDAKFPIKISGIPAPELTWYKNGSPLKETDRIKFKRDGETGHLVIKNCEPDDSGAYKCVAKNREGEDVTSAQFEVVDRM